MLFFLFFEWWGLKLVIVDLCGRGEVVVILFFFNWGFDRLRLFSGVGFWLIDFGIFYVYNVDV